MKLIISLSFLFISLIHCERRPENEQISDKLSLLEDGSPDYPINKEKDFIDIKRIAGVYSGADDSFLFPNTPLIIKMNHNNRKKDLKFIIRVESVENGEKEFFCSYYDPLFIRRGISHNKLTTKDDQLSTWLKAPPSVGSGVKLSLFPLRKLTQVIEFNVMYDSGRFAQHNSKEKIPTTANPNTLWIDVGSVWGEISLIDLKRLEKKVPNYRELDHSCKVKIS